MMIKSSGAGVPQWKVDAIVDYLKREFPDGEINWVPKGDQIADLFQVIKSSEAAHRLLVRRKFFDRYDEREQWPEVLAQHGVVNRMKQAGPDIAQLD